MPVLNYTELTAKNTSLFADNATGDITPALLREYNLDNLDSFRPLGVLIQDGVVNTIAIPADPATLHWPHFTTNRSVTNDIFTPDFANGDLIVKEPCVVLMSFTLNGEWSNGEDLKMEIFKDIGAGGVATGVIAFQEGHGTNDPTQFSMTRQFLVVDTADITAGGGSVSLSLHASSVTGAFNLNQLDCKFGAEYQNLSIRTV